MSEFEKEPRWADNLGVLMKARNLNPRSLSLKAGLGATAVRDLLEGRARFPRYDTVEALARALDVTPAQLMGGKALATQDAGGNDDPLKDESLDLLTEIIARLQEVVEERKQQIAPRDFAAMVASLYRQMLPDNDASSTQKGRARTLSKQIDHLVSYESLRRRKIKES